jgi:8-oxo-dGTP pyrophosphatase MutT (NUDIX family)
MPAAELLQSLLRAHTERDLRALEALFGEGGELVLDGAGSTRGAACARRLLSWLEGGLVLGPPLPWLGQGVGAIYGPDRERVAGELLLTPAGEHVGRLEIYALPGGPARPRERVSIRALVLAPGPRLLMFQCHEPGKPGSWWITPGGGREPGEDDLAALRRELREEVGLELQTAGPCVWRRTHTYIWRASAVRQHERFYVVPVEREVEPPREGRVEGTLAHRWWSPDELAGTGELLAPRQLPGLLASLLRDGPPPSPLDVGL